MGNGADELVEGEVIDAHGQELVPVREAPVTLFKTDDPVEIIAKATLLADALSDVLQQKNLTTKIGGKPHVNVEGWTLCGTMLGVFPVVEWTRPVENGWEARVEARTKDGAVVGAAEAECLRSEKRWANADDYSVRSMAQTRAISKALRAPLGFIVALAGYETTPEEEMPRDQPAAARPFDADKDLLPGAIQGKDAPKRLFEALNGFDSTVDWQETISQVVQSKYGKNSAKELQSEQFEDFLRRLSNAVQWITNHTPAGDFPPVEKEQIAHGFVFAFAPLVFEVIYKIEVEPGTETEPAPIDAETAARIDEELARGADDVPFG